MQVQIKNNLDNPKGLERLYRENKTDFRKGFNEIYPEIQDHLSAQFWQERLNFESEEISWGSRSEWSFILIACLLAGIVAKIPAFTTISEEFFYSRNIGFIVFPFLIAYFAWKENISAKKWGLLAISIGIPLLFINLLPNDYNSDTLVLASIHLPFVLWTILGYSFLGDDLKSSKKRISFLSYNGDLIVMTTLILLAGAILSGLTIGLFDLIQMEIHAFYLENIAVFGLASAPLIGTYLIQKNPQLVNKVSPVIAKIFTPLVLITLVIYLVAIIGKGKNPYTDREFLILFNALLIGVMAIIFFSIAEGSKSALSKLGLFMLLSLSTVTIVINGIALSAILYRISTLGITPNRLAVLGGNVLILINLAQVTYGLYQGFLNKKDIEKVEKSMASYLPIFGIWALFVTFLLPFIFMFK